MPDNRFFEDLGPLSLNKLAADAGVSSAADSVRAIAMVAPLAQAGADAVAFFSDRRYLEDLGATGAGACFIAEKYAERLPAGCIALVTDEPQAAYARAAMRLHRPRSHPEDAPAIHPSASLTGVRLSHGCVIGPDVRIGEGSAIGANTVIGPGVVLGRDCVIGANVYIGHAVCGDRLKVAAGSVIGEAGFGVAASSTGAIDVPQLGRVMIGADVTIGACTCIDRGAWDDTVIGDGCKIDNLVQIGHNSRLGRFVLLAGHVGISGSCTVGDGVMMGGSVGLADHVNVGAGASIAARGGVMHDIPEREVWAGAPAKPIRKFMRETAWLAKMAAAGSKDPK